jgi:hypothetical protein
MKKCLSRRNMEYKVTDQNGEDITEEWAKANNILDLSKLGESMPYKWKIQARNKFGWDKCPKSVSCVAYVDARQVQDKLDEVVGPANWQNKFQTIDGHLYCSIGIRVNGEWVWKEDIGTESDYEKDKGQASDAFKRAAVHWGIGRFLYSLEIQKVGADDNHKPMTSDGKKIYDLTKHIQNITGTPSNEQKAQKVAPTTQKVEKAPEGPSKDVKQGSVPMPSDFKNRVFSQDKEINQVIEAMFTEDGFNESYAETNRKWIKGLPTDRKKAFLNCVPKEHMDRFVSIINAS